jgi:formylmethanofuran dehydrogenase subunit B
MPTECKPVCHYCGFDDCESQSRGLTTGKPSTGGCLISGTKASENAAIDAAKEMLARATAPLVCGLNCLDSESQIAAWKLADRLRATVDTTLTNRNRAAVQTFQRYGKVTATYGEIKNRSDLIVLWDCDLESHAKCLALLIGDTKIKRRVVFVGDKNSPGAENADLVFAVPTRSNHDRDRFIQLAYLLRTKLAGVGCDSAKIALTGLSVTDTESLFQILTECDYGCLFFKQHSDESEFDLETESLMLLVRELNSKTRFVGSKLRDDLNGLGAETVLTLASGFPQAVNLSRSFARQSGLSYSAATLLARSAVDVVVLFGQLETHQLSTELVGRLSNAKVIQIGPAADDFADVFIAGRTLDGTAETSGSVFRGDGAMLNGSGNSMKPGVVDLLDRLV